MGFSLPLTVVSGIQAWLPWLPGSKPDMPNGAKDPGSKHSSASRVITTLGEFSLSRVREVVKGMTSEGPFCTDQQYGLMYELEIGLGSSGTTCGVLPCGSMGTCSEPLPGKTFMP